MDAVARSPAGAKDPRIIARKYQLELCRKAMEENIIVCLGTGCGKTHIAVLLMYELRHLIREPSEKICVFLAPTVPLVRQQAMVIENSTDFKVRCYFGHRKQLKDHDQRIKTMEQSEVFVMTPEILLQNLRHCYIKMELVALLIFDECHHAQLQTRHPYAQIMKEFYKSNATQRPRIFGMTASPSIGKGGPDQLNYAKCINSLETLLDAKVCTLEDDAELESVVASPEIKVYLYGPVIYSASSSIPVYRQKLERIKQQCMSSLAEKVSDLEERQKKLKLLRKIHTNMIFCLENIGLCGTMQAVQILLSSERFGMMELEVDNKNEESCLAADEYFNKAASVIGSEISDDFVGYESCDLKTLKEPFFSKKLSALVGILSTYRLKANKKCIIFVKRIITARALASILGSLKSLDFWKCEFLVGLHSGLRNMSRKKMNAIVEKFSNGQVNLLVATNVAEEGLDIQTCCLVVRFDLPETVASFIQSRGRARMLKSEYIFLVERGNQCEEKLLDDFLSGEENMKKQINCRTSADSFDDLEEKYYKVDATGASVSTGYSVSLLHRYCSQLPKDIYFTPLPNFFYIDDPNGSICRVVLPPNAPLRQVDSLCFPSKDEAKRAACLNACIQLHKLGALTDFLLPSSSDEKKKGPRFHHNQCVSSEDELLREELHDKLVPASLKVPWTCSLNDIKMYFYFIRFVPIPEDRSYRSYGLFMKVPLPKEAEALEVDLHLSHGRIVKTSLLLNGMVTFDMEEIMLAQNFQEMSLKVILDRSEFFSDNVPLGRNDSAQCNSSTFYLLLPVKEQGYGESMTVDWTTVKRCLSSPVFHSRSKSNENSSIPGRDTLELLNGSINKLDVVGSLVFTPHNKLFFFIDDILHGINAYDPYATNKVVSYAEYYKKKFGIQLSRPEQPFLKAKQLFVLHNLLHNRVQSSTETREIEEHFVELPPELCCVKIAGFSKDIGSSLSLLPSLMHRLENLLVAIELKELLSVSFPEGSEIRADCILQALTTEKCLERLSLERFEVLGDAFLKYAVGRHSFLSYEGLDEGQLTRKRSSLVNNSHLYDLAIQSNLQVYIRDELFDPSQYFAFGRPCKLVCNVDNEASIHGQQVNGAREDGALAYTVKCTKSHRWLHRKTIADVVEALIGAFLVESGFKAAISFLRWIGIEVDFEVSNVHRVCQESKINMSLAENMDVDAFEEMIGYKFKHRGLLLQALVHPSYNKHSGGCYQKLEFLGDAVLEYLITSYLYSVYPDLKPGQLTDLRSITVNNNSFAHIAVWQSFHKYLIKDSNSLTEAITKFESYVNLVDSQGVILEEPACPKVLGDIVESCIGAVLLDTGFCLTQVWHLMLKILEPVLGFSTLQFNPVRELRELCQCHNFALGLPEAEEIREGYSVAVEVGTKDKHYKFNASNHNSKAARRMAAQEALSVLKARGYKHKNKSLEEIVQTTNKMKPILIGFDEEPIDISPDDDSISLENLQIQESKEVPCNAYKSKVENAYVSSESNAIQFSSPLRSGGNPKIMITEACNGNEPKLNTDADSISLENSRIRVLEEIPCKLIQLKAEKDSLSSKSFAVRKQFSTPPRSTGNPKAVVTEACNGNEHRHKPVPLHQFGAYDTTEKSNHKETIDTNKTGRSRLMEICTANCWNPPSYVCCKEEGPSHLRMFTYKVTVRIEGSTSTVLKCYSESKPQKKAAQEHAAEGALWYLRHLTYI